MHVPEHQGGLAGRTQGLPNESHGGCICPDGGVQEPPNLVWGVPARLSPFSGGWGGSRHPPASLRIPKIVISASLS